MRQRLKKEVDSCTSCLRFNTKREGFHPSRSPDAEGIWDHVMIDLVGPLPVSEGYIWIFVFVDVASDYVVLRAMKSKSMEDSSFTLWSVICEYGVMKVLQSDRGPEFVNEMIAGLTNMYGVDHRLISA